MGDLFNKDFLKDSESLFKNYLALDISFFPPIIKYRENEQQYIAECIKPLFNKRNGKNLIVTGNPGIGKTLAIKSVFKELEEKCYDDVKPIYVNCWKDSSSHRIALTICDAIGYKFVHNKNTNDLFDEIKRILNRKAVVICFDEADKIEDVSAVYLVLEQIYNKTIIFITNSKEWISRLDPRLRSRLTPEALDFRDYNEQEIKGILKQRIDYAFFDDVFDKDAFMTLIEYTSLIKDVRSGLFLLRESGDIAESKSKKKISAEDVEEAIKKIKESKPEIESEEKIREMDNDEKLLWGIIKENNGKSSTEIHDIYTKRSGKEIKYRRFKDSKLNVLRDLGFINLEEVSLGTYGTKTIVNLNKNKKLDEF
ncbi:AAA family ATPase [Candidatus Woesearchaeota archaeon]|nr:AAA family ATPase [Candidatus Woesearchaeota archaeon]